MGAGAWAESDFKAYSTVRGYSTLADGSLDIKNLSTSQVYKQREVADKLNPYGVKRECVDSDEHPNTVPVILALDVTGSMGSAAIEVAAELNKIMTRLYEEVEDVEFMIMGIGDFVYDKGPLQVSQFESDIRIAEQLDLVWFEFGGGWNEWESYTAPWVFADTQIQLDCWKRGKKGIIITMGDEILNPYLPAFEYNKITGQQFTDQELNTKAVYQRIKDRYDIYHINVDHSIFRNNNGNVQSFTEVLGEDHVMCVPIKDIAQAIVNIVTTAATALAETAPDYSEGISW